jgi:hypothetical protein
MTWTCPSFRPVPFSPFRIARAGVRAGVDSGCGPMGDFIGVSRRHGLEMGHSDISVWPLHHPKHLIEDGQGHGECD